MKSLFRGKKVNSTESLSEDIPPANVPPKLQLKALPIECGSQFEIPTRTVCVWTSATNVQDSVMMTDTPLCVDRDCSTETPGFWDASTQYEVSSMEAGVDPGEWNSSPLRGVDSQTDVPDPGDHLFWMSGSLESTSALIAGLLTGLETECADTSSSPADSLRLRADNILLRIEVDDLKRRLNRISATSARQLPPLSPRRPTGLRSQCISRGSQQSQAKYEVVTDRIAVTSSLAPSSTVLGCLKAGDKILSAGHPEDIGGLTRVPLLPKGWITIRDKNTIYLRNV